MKMSILPLSFILVFLQSLALDYKLLVSYTFMKHVVVHFIIVGIILFITKLLLSPIVRADPEHNKRGQAPKC
jgi:vacuolar-type H+-ATPase subunit I/STV1